MLPGELAGIHFLPQESPIHFLPHEPPCSFPLPHQSSTAAINRILYNNFQANMTINDYFIPPPNANYTSSNGGGSSTSDEADEQQMRIIDERKQRRMISNRESARRSRMRKQKHLDELWSQVVRLRTENHNLLDKLNHVSECHDRVLEENARLKEEASGLRQMLTDLPIGSPYTSAGSALSLRGLDDDVPCNAAHLRADSSSIPTSVDLLL